MGCDLIRSCDHLCLGASTTKPCIFDVHFFPVLLRRPGGHGGGSRVYFSPLRGNAWKPRSWENMGQVQKLWLLTAIIYEKDETWFKIWTSSAKISMFPKIFQKKMSISSIVLSPEVLFSSAQFRTLAYRHIDWDVASSYHSSQHLDHQSASSWDL